MVATHDIYQDLGFSKDEIEKRRAEDSQLDELLKDYASLDEQIVMSESLDGGNSSDDEPTHALKAQRLQVKDRIVTQLRSNG
ncbi:DUF465 domain-containing protein [Pseudomonas sp.]|uniref:DUF465 domain-containing protein n=1 Tax=Pseudomonas sp. TaxID=306 RepID=UPI00272A094D|nr:DUF465 domain-containing protein [Pseudomonas sp.]